MMITLVVIGVLAAAIAPALSEVQSDQRQAGVPHQIIRLSRVARGRTYSMGVAHLLRFQADAASGLGSIEMWMGMNNRCLLTPWDQAFNDTAGDGSLAPLEILNMVEHNAGETPSSSTTGQDIIRLSALELTATGPVARTMFQVCYQPNGLTYTADSNVNALRQQETPYQIVVRRTYNDGSSTITKGVDRRVIFPLGGAARTR